MQSYHLGIDVAKAKLDCALRLADGKFKHKVVENNQKGFALLSDWLSKHDASGAHVCMEATGVYWEAVAEYLANRGMTVSVINPAQIKAFGTSRLVRTKTDKVDAKLIADFCFERHPAPWQAPSPSEQALRALVLRLDSLQTMKTQERNRLEVARDIVKADIVSHIAWLDKEIESLIKKIHDHLNNDPDMRNKQELLDSIPGLGERTIAHCSHSACILDALPTHDRLPHSPALIRVSMNLAAASRANPECPKSGIASCAKRCTCQLW